MKSKTGIIAKFHRTDLLIYSHSRKGKTPPYSHINTVILPNIVKSYLWTEITVVNNLGEPGI